MAYTKRGIRRMVKTGRRMGVPVKLNLSGRKRKASGGLPRVAKRVANLYRMIETKESGRSGTLNLSLAHNDVTIFGTYNQAGLPHTLTTACNPFSMANQGADDAMAGPGSRIGDSISVKGLLIRGFFENALQRPKVYYRVMLVRTAKGELPTRANIFKEASGNKMIDQINRERVTIVAQKIFTINSSNSATNGVDANGVPYMSDTSRVGAGVGTKTFKMWIPGYKFGRNGIVTYENASLSQVKFYDYRIAIVAYDWYGTPQDINAVGKVNEMYTKLYYKDA